MKKETLDASLQSMVGTPVIIKHQNVTKENADKLRIGTISKAYFNEPDGWFYCEGIIWDEKAQDLIENKNWSVSCSYDFLAYNDEGGEENNIHYDKEFTNLNFTHLAIVDNPRYERANIIFNCKLEDAIDTKSDVDNSKEIEMNLIDKLQELINSVKNEKENEMEVQNEAVDKRKLIDEVAGIMKSAGCDDEVIRTAIGKMEKIGYDKSEADGKTDNKKVKNETEEEKKEKVENEDDEKDKKDKKDEKDEVKNKCKNEDEKDKKEVKEVKEEVKKDVDNKCKNSKEDTSSFDKINEIYNSVRQLKETKTYVSRQEKLDNAVEYFK